jgi:hypothetical protein
MNQALVVLGGVCIRAGGKARRRVERKAMLKVLGSERHILQGLSFEQCGNVGDGPRKGRRRIVAVMKPATYPDED